jgi:hypothetical protein
VTTNTLEMNGNIESRKKEIEGIKKHHEDIVELENTITEIKTHWMG